MDSVLLSRESSVGKTKVSLLLPVKSQDRMLDPRSSNSCVDRQSQVEPGDAEPT